MLSNDTCYVPALRRRPSRMAAAPTTRTAPTAEESRRKLMDRVIADKMMVCGSHFPFPGAGTFAKDGSGYALTVNKA